MVKVLLAVCVYWMTSMGLASELSVQRYALVIGNQSYATAPLKNAENDASAIAASLAALGFKVSLLKNSNLADLTAQVQRFYAQVQRDASSKKMALVYYAGHAIQVANDNYIVPLGLKFETYSEFIAGLYKIDTLFTEINKSKDLQNIIILDACRNNPFENNAVAAQAKITSGLASVKAPTNTMIAFATEPGGVAADGKRENGVYTHHLLRHIHKQINVEEVFKKVRKGVARDTRNQQIPWEHSSLLSEVFFSPPVNRDLPDILVF